ncbi:MAG TPA: hypothetical protein VKO62_02210, partial [Solirubrobacterales bacterium]|nr:hypothetical protein [Solirubrobacterales bacterium]
LRPARRGRGDHPVRPGRAGGRCPLQAAVLRNPAAAIWRPAPLEAGRQGLVLAGAFGVALAGMNLCFYEALDRIPLGMAVTFEFVGPLLVGLLGSRRALLGSSLAEAPTEA